MPDTTFVVRHLIVAFVAVFALTDFGFAQEAADKEQESETPPVSLSADEPERIPSQIDEITVTARKREELAQNTPVTLTALSGRFVDDIVTRDIGDLAGYVPNLVVDPVGATPNGGSFYIRGLGTQEVERSFDPAVGFFLDGVYLSSSSGTFLETFDVERIEVLRGPQGTLFGKNTIGGAISVTRTKPTGEFGAKGRVTLGSHGRNDYAGVLNIPVVEDLLAAKYFFFRNNDDGYFRNQAAGFGFGSRQGGERYQSQGIDLLLTPTENFEFSLKYERAEDGRGTSPLRSIAGPGEASGAATIPTSDLHDIFTNFGYAGDFDLDAITAQADYTLGPVTLTSITGWRATDERVFQDFDATSLTFLETNREQQHRQFSQEIRASTQLGERVDLVTGFYYIDTFYNLHQTTQSPFIPGGASSTDQRQDSDAFAGFGHADISLTDQLRLSLGLRYIYEEKRFKGRIVGLPASPGKEDWDELTPKVGLDYQLTDDFLAYANWSKGFRSGGFNGRNSTPASIGPYDPEKVYSWEGGIKSNWFDRRLQFNLASFYTQYDDKQEEIIQDDPILASATVVQNAAEADIWGWEVEAQAIPLPGLTVRANTGYLDAEYDKFIADLNGDGMKTDNSSLILRRTPEWTYGLSGEYLIGIGPGTFGITGAYRYVDNYVVEASNDSRGFLDDVGLTDATLSYELETRLGTHKVILFGRNLQDIVTRNSAVVVPGLIAFSGVNDGRTFGVTLQTEFTP